MEKNQGTEIVKDFYHLWKRLNNKKRSHRRAFLKQSQLHAPQLTSNQPQLQDPTSFPIQHLTKLVEALGIIQYTPRRLDPQDIYTSFGHLASLEALAQSRVSQEHK